MNKKRTVPAGERQSSALRALTSMFVVAALLSGCGGGSGGSAPSAPPAGGDAPGAPASAPIGINDPNPPANEPGAVPTIPSLPTSTADALPPPPPSLQLPSGVDLSKPGVLIKPTAASSPAVMGGNTAAMAIDGDLSTRWESTHEDGGSIQFDFGAKTLIGYMKLVWENAYGKEYTIQVSDDGVTWYQLRYIADGSGGTEEFFNLNANVRYVRMKGVRRATQYGFSLFEVEFRSPGSDNTLGTSAATSFVPFPASGDQLAPPPAATDPLEVLQFTLPDGTLVTRFGVRGVGRHGRERGEEWNEIGYGPNETVNPATGAPVDKGPGAYLPFVANYFKNRTWGFEIIDNSRVAGVANPSLKVNQYFQQEQLPGGVAWFRGFDNPNVTGYGWMRPGELVDRSLTICPPMPYPPAGQLASANLLNNGCSLTVADYPSHRDLDANGFPNGKDVASRPLRVGDAIEVSPSFFSTKDAMAKLGDTGGIRYYAGEWTYVVGVGLRPWYGVQPRLMNAPLPDETLQGGTGSIPYDYSDNSPFMFQQPFNHIGMHNMQRFVEGRRWFHTNMRTGDHNEPGNDRNQPAVGLQGPHFNQSSCFGCHINNGRGIAPIIINQRLDTMAVRTAEIDGSGRQMPHPVYGMAAQMNARPLASDTKTDWGTGVRVAGFETKTVVLVDGTKVELSKPIVAFEGPAPGVFSLRAAMPVIGMGLLEAVSDADIIARARATPDADGVKGQVNYAFDPETGQVRVGRYGWKASKVSLRHQVAGAALLDMSVTSPVFPNRDCLFGPAKCNANKVEAGISEDALKLLTRYVSLLGVPAQRSLASGFPKGVSPLPPLDVNPTQVASGAKVFATLRCTACHVSEMKTGIRAELAEARNQTIKPYTDLLLHDMGEALADGRPDFEASGSDWRTAPLWGIGLLQTVNHHELMLHDGRARGPAEAILWHGGEADASRERFRNASESDRDALLSFLRSL